MTTPDKSTLAKPADTLSWKNIIVLLIIFTFGILTGIVTQFADRCPFLNPQPVDPNAQVEDQVRQRFQMVLRQEQNNYIRKIREWKKPYAEKINAALTPEQLKQLEPPRQPHAQPIPYDESMRYRLKGDRMTRALTEIIAYQQALDQLEQKVTLTDKQKVAITKILIQRRDDFLKFIDQNPPPKALPRLAMDDYPVPEMELEDSY